MAVIALLKQVQSLCLSAAAVGKLADWHTNCIRCSHLSRPLAASAAAGGVVIFSACSMKFKP